MASKKLDDIINLIEKAIEKFHGRIDGVQRQMFDEIVDRLTNLKIRNGRIQSAVDNLRVMNDIRTSIREMMMTPEYQSAVREFARIFNTINQVQTNYFQQIDSAFKPSAFADEMRKQMIETTVNQLTGQGIGSGLEMEITEVLRQNITSGSSYSGLTKQLREMMLDTDTDGVMLRYAKQITTDAVNQYTAQNFKLISDDLNYEWYRYAGHDIKTTRPFCDAMTDREYFHVSEIPDLLKAVDLYYSKDGQQTKVPIYKKTGLPHGMIEGTNETNFFVRRGGYNCGHQTLPVIERLVPAKVRDRVQATAAYKRWKSARA